MEDQVVETNNRTNPDLNIIAGDAPAFGYPNDPAVPDVFLESSSWPTRVTFSGEELATGEDAGLEFEFDPTKAPRPQWASG